MEGIIIILLLALIFKPVRDAIGCFVGFAIIAFLVVSLMAYGVIPN